MFSDNSPQFACAEFRKLSNDWEIEHTTSSPRYPESSGKVDNAVTGNMQDADEESRVVKDVIYLALFAFRNTPSEGVNVSPTLKLFTRRTTADFGTFNSASDLM